MSEATVAEVTREVQYPPAQLAPSAEQIAARLAASGVAWWWFDGSAAEAAGEPPVSSLGLAAEVREAVSGEGEKFLSGLRGATWAVALGYELGVELLRLDPAADTAAPGFALRMDVQIRVDHRAGRITLGGRDDAAIDSWLREHSELLAPGCDESAVVQRIAPRRSGVSWRRSDAQYAEDVETCRGHIRDGDAYVLCLTDVAESDLPGALDPLPLYLTARGSTPAIRGAILSIPGRALVSLSPERFLTVRGRTVSTRPIKGTRPRGATAADDAAYARALANDPKERAENLMIVDLMRNDLSRVCAPGTVTVSDFLAVEHHPQVHQLVSTVSGQLRGEHDVIDALGVCFPGGSMTGAPKRRAVALLAEVEAAPRGLYAGCFGWLSESGDAELAMTIRSVELRSAGADTHAWIGAGGGITIDSVPAAEVAEKHLKAERLRSAL